MKYEEKFAIQTGFTSISGDISLTCNILALMFILLRYLIKKISERFPDQQSSSLKKIVIQMHYVFCEYLHLISDFLHITSEPLRNKKVVLRVYT